MPSPGCTNAFTLPGTTIVTIANFAQALSCRTHRIANDTENPGELWYYRSGGWTLFPAQPLYGPDNGIQLSQTYKQPATLQFTLPDVSGLYATENLESTYNYNTSGIYDPLLDEARKICFRAGTKCYGNLASGITPTSSLATRGGSSAALSALTDDITSELPITAPSYFCQFAPVSVTPFTFTIDFGTSKFIRHAVIRFATAPSTCTLPSSVQIGVSSDNVTYKSWPVRPVGGAGSASITPGDWHDSNATTGQVIECAFCDLEISGRYFKFTITPTSAQTIYVDEIAVYGGTTATILGCNLFTGYMGDAIDFTNAGRINCVAVDVLKRLADNSDVFLTAAYKLTSSGGWEIGDIIYSLLTSTAYWKSANTLNDYDHPFGASEISWSNGSGLTGLQYPLWQGQSNSILGYCQELFNVVGWHFYAEGNGVLTATEPPISQRLPDRVCLAATDGNYDVGNCRRHRTGKLMRNEVIVQTGKSKAAGSGSITSWDPNSLSRFGARTTRITDPLAATTALRQKVAEFFLRDYAWNLQTLTCVIRPTFETKLKNVFGFRAPARPNLYSRMCSIVGKRRKRELWSLVSLTHHISYGKWDAEAEFIPYVAQVTSPPDFTALNAVGGHTDQMNAVFTSITDANVVLVKAYVSITSEFSGFAIYSTALPTVTPILLTGLTPGNPIWVYLTSVDEEGNDSLPSQILTAIPGSTSQLVTCYTITDFTVDSTSTQGPDSQGYYTYQFLGLWTAPACGFTQDDVRAFVGGAPPSDPENPDSWPLHDDSWNWWAPDRIDAGFTWDNTTPGQLDFVFTFRSTSNLSGLRIYFRIWNSGRTRVWIPVVGNYDFAIIL